MQGNQSLHEHARRRHAMPPGMFRSDYATKRSLHALRYVERMYRKHVRQRDRLTLLRAAGIFLALCIM
jgi:hypothetical protein